MSLYRCYVCNKCSIVSYHPISYCPNCPGKIEKVVDESSKLQELYSVVKGWIPAEADNKLAAEGKQPWVVKANKEYEICVGIFRMWLINQHYSRLNYKYNVKWNEPFPAEAKAEYDVFKKQVEEAADSKNVPLDKLEELTHKLFGYRLDLHALKSLFLDRFDVHLKEKDR